MISQVAKELGIVVLLVSHIPEQKEGADRLFHTTLGPGRISQVVMEENNGD